MSNILLITNEHCITDRPDKINLARSPNPIRIIGHEFGKFGFDNIRVDLHDSSYYLGRVGFSKFGAGQVRIVSNSDHPV